MNCKLCTVLSESFLLGSRQHVQKDSNFSLFYTIKAQNGKITVLGDFFSASINRSGMCLIMMSLLKPTVLSMKFPNSIMFAKIKIIWERNKF